MKASGWACHCDGRCPSAARALLISNFIDEKEFTTAIFSALFHGRGKQRNIALLGSSANEEKSFIWAPMKEIYPQGSVCLAPSASAFPLLHVEASKKISSRASTFKMAVRGSQVLRPSRKKLNLQNIAVARTQFWVLRARRFSTLLNAPRCRVRSFWPVSSHSKKKIIEFFYRIEPTTIRYTVTNCICKPKQHS